MLQQGWAVRRIEQEDLVQSLAEALQFISHQHPPDFVRALRRAWQAGAGPGAERLVVDLDSFVVEVHGARKQGTGYCYTHKLGYHPIIATRADTLETLHIRLRKGSANTQRGAVRFVDELAARLRRAGARGEILVRAPKHDEATTGGFRAGDPVSLGWRSASALALAD